MKDESQYFRSRIGLDVRETPAATSNQEPSATYSVTSALQSVDGLTNHFSRLQAELGQIRNTLAVINSENISLRKNLNTRINDLGTEKNLSTQKSQRLAQADSEIRVLREELKKSQEKVSQLTIESERSKNELMTSTMKMEELYRRKVFELQTQVSQKTELTEQVNARLLQTEEKFSQLSQENSELKTSLRDLQDVERERDQLKLKGGELLRKNSLLQRALAESQAQKDLLVKSEAELKETLKKSEIDFAALEEENMRVRSQLRDTYNLQYNMSKSLEEAKEKISHVNASIETMGNLQKLNNR